MNTADKSRTGSLDAMLARIAAPGAEFRGAPFWSWNAGLEPEELRRQIREFKKMGLGGFFMHSRVGLDTPYLGAKWFECVRACIDEAAQCGMKAWLYDEDRWPSGAGGGLVTTDPQFRQRGLIFDAFRTVPEQWGEYLAAFAAVIRDETASRVRPFHPGDVLDAEESLLIFRCHIAEPLPWYNNQTYLDTLNPEAVRRFIEVTHEAYFRECGDRFGGTVPGIFTDEPNYFVESARPMTAWTEALPDMFAAKYGYSILDHPVEIFYRVDGVEFSRARYDYYRLLTDLFTEAFSKQIGEWCARHRLLFTGHAFFEDTLPMQTRYIGSAMRFYEYQQAPGIDLLTERWRFFDTAKQCSSMAHQFDRQWRLAECFGCTGWDFPLTGHLAIGEWLYACGINFRCQHLAFYSMAGQAKRDFPASISFQSAWSKAYREVEDHFAQLGAALSEGEEVRELLVIHPIESTWGIRTEIGFSNPDCWGRDDLDESRLLSRLSKLILESNIDFDYGDEDVISRHGAVENGKFRIGRAEYSAVLIPTLRTIRSTTLELLRRFADAGGCVAYFGNIPALVDGREAVRADAAYARFRPLAESEFSDFFTPAARRVSMTADGREIAPLLHLQRRAATHSTLFVCNYGEVFSDSPWESARVVDRTLAFPDAIIAWKLPPEYEIFELALDRGDIVPVKSTYDAGYRRFHCSFAPLESHCYLATTKKIADAPAPTPCGRELETLTLPPDAWQAFPDEPNVLILDHAESRLDHENWRDAGYMLTLDNELRDRLGVPHRGAGMVQPWTLGDRTPSRTIPLSLRFRFECCEIPEASPQLALEAPDLFRIELNGTAVPGDDRGWWCDTAIRKIDLPRTLLRQGENQLILHTAFHEFCPGLEALYLLGDFGVDADRIVSPVRELNADDWCRQRFPYYSGNMRLRHSLELHKIPGRRYVLEVPKWSGAGLVVRLNDSAPQFLLRPPYRTEITDLLSHGENRLEIEILGHRRNSFGPFYIRESFPMWTDASLFAAEESTDRLLVPCGLLASPLVKIYESNKQ